MKSRKTHPLIPILLIAVLLTALFFSAGVFAQEETPDVEAWQTLVSADTVDMTALAPTAPPTGAPVADTTVGEIVVDTSDVPPADVEDAATNLVTTMIDVANLFSAFIMGVAGAFVASPATQAIVAGLKRVSALDNIPANVLSLIVGVILWVGAALSGHFGLQTQYGGLVEAVPVLVGLLSTLIGAPIVNHMMVKNDVAVLGYTRT